MGRIRNRRIPGTFLHMVLTLSNRHVHAQIVDREAGLVITSAHTVERELRNAIHAPARGELGRYATASVASARTIGEVLGERMQQHGIEGVYWSRPGKYHGKIKAFVDAVREKGIKTYTPPHSEMPKAPTKVPGVE